MFLMLRREDKGLDSRAELLSYTEPNCIDRHVGTILIDRHVGTVLTSLLALYVVTSKLVGTELTVILAMF